MTSSQAIRQPIVFQPQTCLDEATLATIEQAVAQCDRGTFFAIDMSQVEMIDSPGLFTLVSALRTAREHGSRLAIYHLKSPVRVIFEITQLDRIFEIFDTQEEAIAAIAPELCSSSPNSDLAAA
ncbi:STAS domain-containing protein [Laspinema olomoucense]|uniref:STAS domain-containing protein n=1 Tax=Laspinema olomoucense D3b TaxID=2953688 RepID=A0ABT2NE44_9CYAN|nr:MULTISPECIES: STAS domain-containing protein [unclassified Laspinema]MCT7980978.1 STAS domain-containing protein [Laspinema sp. D3b]MCT7991551.1 STAS domain-containing protein [Laspinema sp. D3a]MCT7996911.1 STAS domain-containing protein [Laspinema sp. D3c]